MLRGWSEVAAWSEVHCVGETSLVWVCFQIFKLKDEVRLCGVHRICFCLCILIFLLGQPLASLRPVPCSP